MNLKRLMCLMVVLVLAFAFVLTGCQKTPADVPEGDVPEQGGEDAAEETPAETDDWPYNWSKDDIAEPVALTWFIPFALEQADEPEVEAAINDFLKDKINATIDLIFMEGDPYQDTMGARLAAGEAMDIVFTSGWARSPNYRQSVSQGLFTVLNDYVKEGGILSGTAEILGESFLNATQINGNNYAIPCNKEQAHNWGFLFRKDIVEELDLDIQSVANKNALDALTALEPILAKVHEAYPEMIPFVTCTGESAFRLLDWDTISGDVPGALYPDNRDTTIINQYKMPETEAFYRMMEKFYKAGYIRKDADTYADWQADLDSGLGFCISQSMKPGKDIEYSMGSPYEFVQVDCTGPVMSNREADGSMMAIPVSSENPDRAAMLMELANTDKWLNNTLNFGLENKHFTKIDEVMIELSEENTGYRPNITWVLPNQFMNYVMKGEDPEKFVKFTAYNQSALPMNSLGFMFDGSSVANEISALQAITTEYFPMLNAGTMPVDTIYPEFLAELDAADADKVIAEMQTQFDAWLASK